MAQGMINLSYPEPTSICSISYGEWYSFHFDETIGNFKTAKCFGIMIVGDEKCSIEYYPTDREFHFE
jgi:hypothetical protein